MPSRSEIPGQVGIDLPEEHDVPAVAVRKAPEGVSYTRYAAKTRHRCDHCMQAQASDPAAPAARLAQMRRKTADTDELLCSAHEVKAREADGFTQDDKGRWIKREGDK